MKLFTITGMKVSEGIHSNNINIPFVDGMLKLLAGIENGMVVKTADITTLKDGTQRIVREGHYNDRRALVFLTCPADCQLRFMANTIDEVIENGLVRRVPRGIR